MRVSAGQYEIIGLNENGKHVYTKLSNERIFQGLHKALRNYHSRGGVTDATGLWRKRPCVLTVSYRWIAM